MDARTGAEITYINAPYCEKEKRPNKQPPDEAVVRLPDIGNMKRLPDSRFTTCPKSNRALRDVRRCRCAAAADTPQEACVRGPGGLHDADGLDFLYQRHPAPDANLASRENFFW